MVNIHFTWDDPADAAKARALDEFAVQWREEAMRSPGIQSLQAFVHPHALLQRVSVTTWADIDSANRFMSSDVWRKLITEMQAAGATNIKAQVFMACPTTPVPLRSTVS